MKSLLKRAKESLPPPLLGPLSEGKHLLECGYGDARYRLALRRGAPLEVQVRLAMPPPHLTHVRWVQLDDIPLQTRRKWKRREKARLCVGGDWDVAGVRPRLSVLEPVPEGQSWWRDFTTVREIFVEGRDYRTTPQYAKKLREVQEGKWTVADVDAYFERLLAAFASMHEHGYRSQEQLGNTGGDEMMVHVTRRGQLCYGGQGGHRIGMAEILGIRWVPVLLMNMHPMWVEGLSRRSALPPHEAVVDWVRTDGRFLEQRPTDR